MNLAALPYSQCSAIKHLSRVAAIDDLSIVHSALGHLAALTPDMLTMLDTLPKAILRDSAALYAGMTPAQLVNAVLGGTLDHSYIRRLQYEQGLIRRTRGANAANIRRLQ